MLVIGSGWDHFDAVFFAEYETMTSVELRRVKGRYFGCMFRAFIRGINPDNGKIWRVTDPVMWPDYGKDVLPSAVPYFLLANPHTMAAACIISVAFRGWVNRRRLRDRIHMKRVLPYLTDDLPLDLVRSLAGWLWQPQI